MALFDLAGKVAVVDEASASIDHAIAEVPVPTAIPGVCQENE